MKMSISLLEAKDNTVVIDRTNFWDAHNSVIDFWAVNCDDDDAVAITCDEFGITGEELLEILDSNFGILTEENG